MSNTIPRTARITFQSVVETLILVACGCASGALVGGFSGYFEASYWLDYLLGHPDYERNPLYIAELIRTYAWRGTVFGGIGGMVTLIAQIAWPRIRRLTGAIVFWAIIAGIVFFTLLLSGDGAQHSIPVKGSLLCYCLFLGAAYGSMLVGFSFAAKRLLRLSGRHAE